ncbi:MAG: carboxypeptidase regulatory-like domain-containing protein [Acidobacteriota bacterium]
MYQAARLALSSLTVILAIFAIGTHLSVWAQGSSTTASITGAVIDEQGAAIAGAVVQAKNLKTNLVQEVVTDTEGNYLLQTLPPGDYELVVTNEGFANKSSYISLLLGTNARADIILKVGITKDVVDVILKSLADEGKTESSTNIDTNQIESLPVFKRNFLSLSLTAARVVADRTPEQGAGATSGLSFNGQPARFNNFTIDGLDNNDSFSGSVRSLFSQEAVQEFQIVSNSYSTEFGRSLGGIVNIVTKGGSNKVNGNLFLLAQNDKIIARDAFATFKPEFRQYQLGALLSGPIKQNRIFFLTSIERLSTKQNNIVVISDQAVRSATSQGFILRNGPVPFSVGTTSILGRIDAQVNRNDTLYLRYNFGGTYNGALEPFGALIGETNGGIQRLKDNSIAVNNIYISSQLNLTNETRFLYGRRNQRVLPLDNGPQVRIVSQQESITFGRSTILPQLRDERIYQIVNNVSLTSGHHQIKFGVDYQHISIPDGKTSIPILAGGFAIFLPIDFSAAKGAPPGLPVLSGPQAFDPSLRTPEQQNFLRILSTFLPSQFPSFPSGMDLTTLSLPSIYLQGFGNPNIGGSTDFFSLFIQNDFKPKQNLLIKTGLRYDINRATFMPKNSGNFSPRVAFSYRPQWLPALNLRATYGLFFGVPVAGAFLPFKLVSTNQLTLALTPLPFSILPYSLPGHHFPESDQLPSNITIVPQLSQISKPDENLRNSYSQQVSLGFEYAFGASTSVSVSYSFVRGIKIFSIRDINPIVRPIPGDPLNSAIIGRVDPSTGSVFNAESSFDSYYHAFTISANRRFTNRFGFLASYTLSKAIDNFVDLRSDLQEVVDSLQPRNERGLSIQDVRNRFVLSGTWELSYSKNPLLRDFQISAILNLNSGRPYNLLAGADLNMNGDNPPGDRPLGLGRNVGISPGFTNLDLRLTRSLAIKDHYRLQIFIEAFNFLNHVNISDYNRVFEPDSQGFFNLPAKQGGRFIVPPDRFRKAFSPRQFQFGLRLNF